MDSSFFALNPRRLSGFSLRSGHSLSSWDGSEPGLEVHATPQLPQWAQPSGVLFPQTLSIIKPCPDVDGYYPMVRLVTSVPVPFLLRLSSILFLSCYIPYYLPVFSSVRTELVWIFLHPVGPFASSFGPCIPSCPFPNHVTLYHCFFAFRGHSKTVFLFLCCYCYYCCCFLPRDHHLGFDLALWVMNRLGFSAASTLLRTNELRQRDYTF